MAKWHLILLIWFSCSMASVTAVADVKLQFYMLQLDNWNSGDMSSKVRATLATGLKTFCTTRLALCGLSTISERNFTPADIQFSAGYPKDFNSRYLDLAVSISYNLANTSSVNLSVADVTAIVESQRLEIYSRIGHYIVYIGSVFYSVPPPNLANWIVVSIVTTITVAMVIAAVVLGRQHSIRELQAENSPGKNDANIPMQQQQQQHQQQQQQQQSSSSAISSISPNKDAQQKLPLMSAASSQLGTASDNDGFLESLSNDNLRRRLDVQEPSPPPPPPAASADDSVISPATADASQVAYVGTKVEC